MNLIIYVLEFFLNNIIKISVILIATVIFAYLLRKMYREQRLNRFLRLRQKTLRKFKFSSRKMRIIAFSVIITLPLIFVAWFLIITRLPSLDFDDHVRHIDNVEHLVEIHQRYHPNYTAINFGIAPEEGDIKEPTIEDRYLFRHHELDKIFSTNRVKDEMLYTLFENQLIITNISDFNTAVEYDEVIFHENFHSLGIFLTDEYIIVIGKNNDNYQCLPYRLICLDYSDDDLVEILILHRENLTLEDRLAIPGHAIDVRLVDDAILIIVNQPLPYDSEGQLDSTQLANKMPSISHNGNTTYNLFRDIKYIEGTRPNTFTSLIHFNLVNKEIVHETLLTDMNFNLAMTNEEIFIFNNSYIFKDISDHFITPDPIDYINTAITKYSFNSSELTYNLTKIVQGEVHNYQSIEVYEDVRLVTSDKDDILHFIRLTNELSLVDVSELPIQLEVDQVIVKQGNVYILSRSNYYRIEIVGPLDEIVHYSITSNDFPMQHYIHREDHLMGINLEPLFSGSIFNTEIITDGVKYSWPFKNITQDHAGFPQVFDKSHVFNDNLNNIVIIPIYSLEYDMVALLEFDQLTFPNVVYRVEENQHPYFRLNALFYNDIYIFRDHGELRIYHTTDLDNPIYQKTTSD